jgi:hypothetical protein
MGVPAPSRTISTRSDVPLTVASAAFPIAPQRTEINSPVDPSRRPAEARRSSASAAMGYCVSGGRPSASSWFGSGISGEVLEEMKAWQARDADAGLAGVGRQRDLRMRHDTAGGRRDHKQHAAFRR